MRPYVVASIWKGEFGIEDGVIGRRRGGPGIQDVFVLSRADESHGGIFVHAVHEEVLEKDVKEDDGIAEVKHGHHFCLGRKVSSVFDEDNRVCCLGLSSRH